MKGDSDDKDFNEEEMKKLIDDLPNIIRKLEEETGSNNSLNSLNKDIFETSN